MQHSMTEIHKDVQIGEGVRVYQFASLLRGAKIGARTTVGPCSMIDGSEIGEDCRICYGVNMGPGFKVGNGVFLGPEIVLCNDMWPRASKEGFDVSKFDGSRWAVVIEDGASLGVRSTVLPGVKIGKNAMIAAHAVVDRDVPDNHIFTRDGTMLPVGDEQRRMMRRMRFVETMRRPFAGESLPHQPYIEELEVVDPPADTAIAGIVANAEPYTPPRKETHTEKNADWSKSDGVARIGGFDEPQGPMVDDSGKMDPEEEEVLRRALGK